MWGKPKTRLTSWKLTQTRSGDNGINVRYFEQLCADSGSPEAEIVKNDCVHCLLTNRIPLIVTVNHCWNQGSLIFFSFKHFSPVEQLD